MKKIKLAAAVLAAATAVSSSALVIAADEVRVMLNGTEIAYDVPAQIVNDRTLVPLRMTFEAMGATVEWDPATQTVTSTRDGKNLSLTIGSNAMTIDGSTVEIDVPAQIIDDRTLIPARAVAQAYGYDVDWDGAARTVIITSPAETSVPTVVLTPVTPTAAPTEATAAPAEATAAPTAAQAEATAAPAASDFGIEYDSSSERGIGYMKDFKITNAESTADGKLKISYTLQTFFEGNGNVSVTFNCLDETGKVIDAWSRSYHGTDYAWSAHEDSATVSANTKTIVFVAE